MHTEATPFRARHKLLLAAVATTTLSLGAVGVSFATTGGSSTADQGRHGDHPVNSGAVVSDAAHERNDQRREDRADEVNGVNCEDGIIVATGAECDGGPAANQTDATEAGDANEAKGADEVDGVNCEDGIIVATGAECDGGPAANQTDDATEGSAEQD